MGCRRAISEDGGICGRCWAAMPFIERPYCERLGTPFPYDLGPGALSAAAIADPPPYGRARAVAAFEGVARDLVHQLKFRDRLDTGSTLGRWMARAGADILGDADLLVPVPLHRSRLWRRAFNQSALLARAAAEATGRPWSPDVLRRIRRTARQVGLGAEARTANVRGAFKVPAERRAEIAGKRVVLVDDVLTTGATVEAATKELLRAGALSVDILVLARVVRETG
jgi:ComF family protein